MEDEDDGVEEVMEVRQYKRQKTENDFDDEIQNEIESNNKEDMNLDKFISIDWSSGASTTTNSEFEYLGINRHLNKIQKQNLANF